MNYLLWMYTNCNFMLDSNLYCNFRGFKHNSYHTFSVFLPFPLDKLWELVPPQNSGQRSYGSKKAILVSTFLRKLVRTLAWISRRHKLSQPINSHQNSKKSGTFHGPRGPPLQFLLLLCVHFFPLWDFVTPYLFGYWIVFCVKQHVLLRYKC
jgi:hypothetical protein